MQTLKGKDLQLFEEVASLTQDNLKRVMSKYLQKHYKKVTTTVDYIFAEGDIPIALVAHMDTVFSYPPDEIFYDTRKNVMISPDGLGADDRAGVWIILQIIRSGLRPHIILTTDEESGCIGASMLVKDYPNCPFEDLRYLIQLDRRGECDCVFYDCDSPEFEKYVESFGFITAIGSFTDISVICPEWGIAGTNLSVGYRDEHSKSEVLFIQPLLRTLEKVKIMLKENDIPFFEFIASPYSYYNYCYGWDYDYYKQGSALFNTHNSEKSNPFQVQCAKCKGTFYDIEAFAVKKRGGGTIFYCHDCVADDDRLDWCLHCGECFEIDPTDLSPYCEDCKKLKKKQGKDV